MGYIKRIAEQELSDNLSASGAALVKGPKSCGKTETSKQFAKSILEVDRNKRDFSGFFRCVNNKNRRHLNLIILAV